nr:MAG TPA: GIY-YIG nuclease superfamily protein [Caudoviricetes sp.]
MLTKKEILQNKIDFEKYDFAGIYFLIHNNNIVYVGSSTSIGIRLNSHKKNNRMKFDSWFYIKYSCEVEMRYMEAKYIYQLRPRYNIKYNPDYENIRMILFSEVRRRYDSIHKFSLEVKLSVTTLNAVFDLEKETKDYHIKQVTDYLFPNGISEKILNKYKVKEIRIEDFERVKNKSII